MNKTLFYLILSFVFNISFAQEQTDYTIYNQKGEQTDFSAIINKAAASDLVFFGEFHDNAIHHRLESELFLALSNLKKDNITAGAEMFETDVQLILKEYLSGLIREKNFKEEARIWGNYETDYKSLVEFAKAQKISFIATNVPRRYAALVNQSGFEGLEQISDEGKKYFPPLPIPFDSELPCYANMLSMMGGGHPSQNLAKAQALKDATMAWNILKNYEKGKVFIHFNGAYHSDNKEGIVWYVNRYNSEVFKKGALNILVITGFEIDSDDTVPETGNADFTIVTHASTTKTR